jgi:6-phospho-beta-glucosidase
LFVASCLRRADRLGLDEIALLDVREDRLAVILPIAQEIVARSGVPLRLTATADPVEALAGASFVVTTIRVGGDVGRISDERIALSRGVLGQETTGPGGFSMAMRTIPEALRYAAIIDRVAPAAWTFNFSNPAGLVTQALRDAGHDRVIGICDGANAAQMSVAEHLGLDPDPLEAEVFGLNHLSWCRSVVRDGVDLLGPLLADRAFRDATSLGLFDPALVATKGMWINEYLYYFYYAREAVDEIGRAPTTRGEEVRELNDRLFDRLGSAGSIDAALDAYYAYQDRRIASYMPYERRGGPATPRMRPPEGARQRIDEGYAGVALTAIEGLATDGSIRTALNVPNGDAIEGLAPTDVVEVSCRVSRDGVNPIRIGRIPEPELALTSAVKAYERLAARAIVSRSRSMAIDALMCHPLVGSYPLACALVDDYLAANEIHAGTWS